MFVLIPAKLKKKTKKLAKKIYLSNLPFIYKSIKNKATYKNNVEKMAPVAIFLCSSRQNNWYAWSRIFPAPFMLL